MRQRRLGQVDRGRNEASARIGVIRSISGSDVEQARSIGIRSLGFRMLHRYSRPLCRRLPKIDRDRRQAARPAYRRCLYSSKQLFCASTPLAPARSFWSARALFCIYMSNLIVVVRYRRILLRRGITGRRLKATTASARIKGGKPWKASAEHTNHTCIIPKNCTCFPTSAEDCDGKEASRQATRARRISLILP